MKSMCSTPDALFASQAGGTQVEEDRHDFGEARYDLCLAIGTLDTVNDLPLALAADRPLASARTLR